MDSTTLSIVAGATVAGLIIGFFVGRMSHRGTSITDSTESGASLRLLALMQREGRLLDFLLEDIAAYQDAQVGAAVRDIHRGCQKALKEHLTLAPIMPGQEGERVTVPAGFDPSAIRLTGNVTGTPPFAGTLQHHSWRVTGARLAAPHAGQDEFVVAPAEVFLDQETRLE
jgi:hypothetical protein